MELEEMTFNDLPQVVAVLLNKVERVERMIEQLDSKLNDKVKNNLANEHLPMNLDEACEFLKMKKSTMYYHLEKGNIPGTRKGKNYILFKDELLHWAETGRKNSVCKTISETNATVLKSIKRKPKSKLYAELIGE